MMRLVTEEIPTSAMKIRPLKPSAGRGPLFFLPFFFALISALRVS
jgi:hypothetical protein